MKYLPIISLIFALAGCATVPEGPQNRDEWLELHTRIYQDIQPDDLLESAQKVLALSDHDFKFEYPPGLLVARRNWYVYMVLAAAQGQDYWRLQTDQTDKGVRLMLQISRQSGAITPSPVFGASGVIGGAVNSSAMPGTEIYWQGPYQLFWGRLDYMLKRSTDWPTCDDAKAKHPDYFKGDTGALCGVTSDDNLPEQEAAK